MNIKIPRLPYPEDRMFGFLFFIALIVPLAFNIFNYESFETIKYSLLLVLTGGALFFAFMQPEGPTNFRGNKAFFWGLGLFWLWALLTSLTAWDKNYSFFGFYPRFTNGFLFYSVWSIFFLLLGFLKYEQIRVLLKILVFCSGLVAVWGIMQSLGFGFYTGLAADYFNRAAPSFLGNPDFSSMFVVCLVPVTAVLLFLENNFKTRVYYSINLFLQLGALVIFASRGALLGLAVGLVTAVFLTIVFKKQGGLKFLALLLFSIVLAIGLAYTFLNFVRPNTVGITASLNDNNIQDRLGVWKLSLESILKRPLVGVGLGNFELMFEHDRKSPITATGFFDDAHNLPLELAVTGGLPFLVLFLILVSVPIFSALKSLTKDYHLEVIGVISGVIAWLVASLFSPVVIPCYVALAILISACFSYDKKLGNSFLLKGLTQKFAVFLGVVFIVYGLLFITAESLFYFGIKSYNANNFVLADKYTTLAVKLNPVNRLYYIYLAGSAIRSGQPQDKINSLLATTAKFNTDRGYSYLQAANLDYLLLYQYKDPNLKSDIITNLKKAISLDPYSGVNYFQLGQYEIVFNNLDAATADLQQGLAFQPSRDAWLFLAKIYQIQNKKNDFLYAISQAYQFDSGNFDFQKLMDLTKKTPDVQRVPFNVSFSLGALN